MARNVSVSALVFALLGFLLSILTGPVWEARATLTLDSPEALTALPGALAGEGVSAYAIPGTDVMELALRATDPEDAQTRLDRAVNRIPRLLAYLDISGTPSLLVTTTRCLSRPQPGLFALAGGVLGAIAAILWLTPAPKPRKPMDLGVFLKKLANAARKRAVPIFLTAVILSGGNALRIPLTSTPQYPAEALIRVGEYDPATADGLAGAVLGLVRSQLGDPSVTVSRVGQTNLFRLSALSDSKEVAISRLDAFLADFPRLLAHISGNPALTVPEAPYSLAPEIPSPFRGALLGAGIALGFWLIVLTGQVLSGKKGLYSRG